MVQTGVKVFGFEHVPAGVILGLEEDINKFVGRYFPGDADNFLQIASLMSRLRQEGISVIGIDVPVDIQIQQAEETDMILRESFVLFLKEKGKQIDEEQLSARKKELTKRSTRLEEEMVNSRNVVFASTIKSQTEKGVYLMGSRHMSLGKHSVSSILEAADLSPATVNILVERVDGTIPFSENYVSPVMFDSSDGDLTLYFFGSSESHPLSTAV